jgi:hypothetical protein
MGVSVSIERRTELRDLAHFFHEQAELAATAPMKKLPD